MICIKLKRTKINWQINYCAYKFEQIEFVLEKIGGNIGLLQV